VRDGRNVFHAGLLFVGDYCGLRQGVYFGIIPDKKQRTWQAMYKRREHGYLSIGKSKRESSPTWAVDVSNDWIVEVMKHDD